MSFLPSFVYSSPSLVNRTFLVCRTCTRIRQSQGSVKVCLANLAFRPRLVEAIVVAQQFDSFVQNTWGKLSAEEAPHFSVGVDGGLRYDLRLYVPQVEEVK